jgi:hypothetical protein
MTSFVVQPIIGALAGLGIVLALLCPALAGEDATVKAFAAWQGSGQLFATGTKELTFVGALSGTVYVETEKGPLESGRLACPAMVRIDMEDGSQNGTGRCTITAKDGAQIFGDVSCTGIRLVGCDGQFTLTGGTALRRHQRRWARDTASEFGRSQAFDTSVRQDSGGIMFWPALHYTIP